MSPPVDGKPLNSTKTLKGWPSQPVGGVIKLYDLQAMSVQLITKRFLDIVCSLLTMSEIKQNHLGFFHFADCFSSRSCSCSRYLTSAQADIHCQTEFIGCQMRNSDAAMKNNPARFLFRGIPTIVHIGLRV